jgi:hypothetical protein
MATTEYAHFYAVIYGYLIIRVVIAVDHQLA